MMKKNIFEIFKENEDQFDQMPRKEVWDRLNHKLDQQRIPAPGKRVSIRAYLALAASIVILVGTIFILPEYFEGDKVNAMASVESFKTYALEVLEDEEDYRFREELKVQQSYRALFTRHIAEAKPQKPKLNANKTRQLNEAKGQSSDRMNKEVLPERSLEEGGNQNSNKAQVLETNETLDKTTIESDLGLKSEKSKRLQEESMKKRKHTRNKMNSRASVAVTEQQADMEKSKESVGAISDLNSLLWLVGNWESQSIQQRSFEFWVHDKPDIIRGTGYVLEGDDTIFREKMKFQVVNGKVLYFQHLEQEQIPVAYELQSEKEGVWSFVNEEIVGPNAVVFSRESTSVYALEMRSYFAAEASNISAQQLKYLKNRNQIMAGRAKRKMNRINR